MTDLMRQHREDRGEHALPVSQPLGIFALTGDETGGGDVEVVVDHQEVGALPGAQPFVGAVGVQESVAEYRVEMVLARSLLTEVVAALKAAHPYETPAFDVVALINTD